MTRSGGSQKVEREIRLASEARRLGNEGRARVYARRAAGWAVGAWIEAHNNNAKAGSAWSNLQAIACDTSTPSRIRLAAIHLTSRINTESMMSQDVDLIADAELLIQHFKRGE
jgi:hypothetical protein